MKTLIHLSLALALVPLCVWAEDSAKDKDPIVALRKAMWQEMPVGKKDRTSPEPRFRKRPYMAENHYDVPYLGQWRDKIYRIMLDQRDHRARAGHPYGLEYRTRCDIHVPKGKGPFPALITAHGGSYRGGSKNHGHQWINGRDNNAFKAGAERGYVIVNINYILGNGIHPQVQRDTKELVRFLRANAETYKIDPHRIAMIGASAGGWLTGSAMLTSADDLAYHSSQYVSGPDDPSKQRRARSSKPKRPLPLPVDEEQPRHPEYSSRINAIVVDFVHAKERGTPDDPHMLYFKDPSSDEDHNRTFTTDAGHRRTTVELSKKGVHLPDNDQMVKSADGKGEVTLFERVFQFLDRRLKSDEARTPAPEARPNTRVFSGSTTVTLVGSGPDVAIYYTTDGGEPTTGSKRYDKPFVIDETTTIKAIAVAPGMNPSGAMTARFIQGKPPVTISPKAKMLPPAKVGQPYKVTFTAPGATYWTVRMQFDSCGNFEAPGIPKKEPWNKKRENYLAIHGTGARNGLPAFWEGDTCVIKGTPVLPGWSTVLVSAVRDPAAKDEIAGTRLYMLRVDPKEVPRKEE